MHYTKDFSALEGQAKIDAALNAAREFWGAEQYAKIMDALGTYPKPELDEFAMMMSFAGVEGYPVRAIHTTVWGES